MQRMVITIEHEDAEVLRNVAARAVDYVRESFAADDDDLNNWSVKDELGRADDPGSPAQRIRGAVMHALDTCDRCGRPAQRIHVGHEKCCGYDGLCDTCLDALLDTSSSASRQYFIDSGHYLPAGGTSRHVDSRDLPRGKHEIGED